MFKIFKEEVQRQFETMKDQPLFKMNVSKDDLWDKYISSFPDGSNPIFRERTEHDCQCCKSFIRATGNMVAIVDGQLISLWDVEIGGHYQVVADAMSKLVKASTIRNIYLNGEKNVGVDQNHGQSPDGAVETWDHFHLLLPDKCVMRGYDIGTALSEYRSTADVFRRSLTEITLEAIETVLELIDQNSIYRGDENRFAVDAFLKEKVEFNNKTLNEDVFIWSAISRIPQSVAKIRNTAIGTLLVDVSDGKPLDIAVKSFESKVAPTNYKRPTALITQGMIDKAEKEVEALGLADTLERRYAVTEDIKANNVLHVHRDTKPKMKGALGGLTPTAAASQLKNLDKFEEVSISDFIENILPKAESLEIMVENKHSGNMVSLIAPVHPDAKNMLKWNNNFSWNYEGEVTDSMKERVKAAGGDVYGDLRFSIQWNDQGDHNRSDYDAHCYLPNGNMIYYSNKFDPASGGRLDVDITGPTQGVPAVENITFPTRNSMPDGNYDLVVHNYAKRSGDSGFRAEIEFDGTILSFDYPKALRQDDKIHVATVELKNGVFKVIKSLSSTQSSKEIWGLASQQFHPVKIVMNSPNFWDDQTVGNKHYFFMIDKCKHDGPARGFFNEFLCQELHDHRKVFEVLGSKMKTDPSDDQLSGLGFSSTQRNSVLCKVSGSFARTIKITF